MGGKHGRLIRRTILALAVIGLSGCGSGGNSVGQYVGNVVGGIAGFGDISSDDPTMTDGSHYDSFDLRLLDGSYQVDMASDGANGVQDPYVIVYRVESGVTTRVAEDDDSGDGSNARATFTVDEGVYRFVFGTFRPGDYGDYAWAISCPANRARAEAIRPVPQGQLTPPAKASSAKTEQ